MFIFVHGDGESATRHPLEAGESLVGRGTHCRIQINHGSVSRSHACFVVRDEHCTLEDRGSLNGTYVNGVPITTAEVHEGDRIVFGSVAGELDVSAEDRLTLVEGSGMSPLPVLFQRPIDQALTPTLTGATPPLLTVITEIGRSLVGHRPLSETLRDIVRIALESTKGERAFLLLKDEKSGVIVARVVRGRDNREIDRGSISRTVVNRVMSERIALLASDTQADERFEAVQSIAVQKIRSFACVPLWSQDATFGALYLDTFYSDAFTPADLELLTALSHFAALAIEQSRMTARLKEETRRRERLGRYHSPAVVTRILEETTEADTPFLAQERNISVLFADIVGFTTIAEHMPPPHVATLLNRYFGRMTDIVFQHEGTLDKFIGDALLAVFGAPLDQPDHADRAVATALAMRRGLAQLNAEIDGPRLRIRMAVNSGVALAGDIGAPSRRDYTVLGDVVNTASRIETSVAGPGQIVLTRATRDQLTTPVSVRCLGSIALRGRQGPIELFEVCEDDAPAPPVSTAAGQLKGSDEPG
jgi:adenylate cyclase